MNRTNKGYVDVDVLYNATIKYGKDVEDPIRDAAKCIAKYNTAAVLVTQQKGRKIIVDEQLLIARDNLLRAAVKRIFYLCSVIKLLTKGKNEKNQLVTKRIDRTDVDQCVDLLDSFWFALWEIADRKSEI